MQKKRENGVALGKALLGSYPPNGGSLGREIIPQNAQDTLPETNSLHMKMDGWKTTFLLRLMKLWASN